MKRLLFILAVLGLMVTACFPAISQPQDISTPISEADLQGTAAVLSEQTLQALPTNTAVPSETPVIVTPSQTATQPTPTETVNPALLTLTATLLASTTTNETPVSTTETTSAPDGTTSPSATLAAPTSGTAQPLFYGTLPPKIAYGTVEFFNKSHVEVYISLRCVTNNGNVTILEYPVKKNFRASAPAGKYTYIAWVGGRQFDGSFTMDNDGYVTITFYKDKINVKKK